MKVYDKMQAAFPGGEIPAEVVIKAEDVTSPKITAAVKQLETDALATGQVKEPVDVSVSADKTCHADQPADPRHGHRQGVQRRAGDAARRRRAGIVGGRRRPRPT